MVETLLRALFWGVLLFVSYNALVPPEQVTAPLAGDLVLHSGAFAVLTVLLLAAYPRLPWCFALTLLLLYGGAIELAQAQLPERSAEWKDLAVDGAGIALGALCYRSIGWSWMTRLVRWLGRGRP